KDRRPRTAPAVVRTFETTQIDTRWRGREGSLGAGSAQVGSLEFVTGEADSRQHLPELLLGLGVIGLGEHVDGDLEQAPDVGDPGDDPEDGGVRFVDGPHILSGELALHDPVLYPRQGARSSAALRPT